MIGGFWMYAAILEYLQHFSPGRHPACEDFAASALGRCAAGSSLPCFGGAYPSSRGQDCRALDRPSTTKSIS